MKRNVLERRRSAICTALHYEEEGLKSRKLALRIKWTTLQIIAEKIINGWLHIPYILFMSCNRWVRPNVKSFKVYLC
jgi:hypothetical protein